MGRLIFVTGGARSGKSRKAEESAAALAAPVVYLATMQSLDEELRARVRLHRQRRPAGWATIEEPLAIKEAMGEAPPEATILLDCLSLWVSNLILRGLGDADPPQDRLDAALPEADGASAAVLAMQLQRPGALIAVKNEVGSGIVPANALSRYYRDALGLVNQRFASASDEAYLMVSGLPLRLR
jgi:adenosylcobinamide kinase / adenosylcobinamide-phosphate guanylyltransferase